MVSMYQQTEKRPLLADACAEVLSRAKVEATSDYSLTFQLRFSFPISFGWLS